MIISRKSNNLQLILPLPREANSNNIPEQAPQEDVPKGPENISDNASNSNASQSIYTEPVANQRHYHGKSPKDKEVDDFLNLKEKERVSNKIRQCNREKKFQRESAINPGPIFSQSVRNALSD
ncbi:hypothetical protein Glove_169g59 [Diversispora epigaea]|uniref:Uncharacterized protein n=1 Tax=Diversispora epigaea TaxID=1348612 RepID=A0A397IXS2_9GLOM|nr:hypothetical protein Glove_169g59 [Diversispora epigaea]